MQDEPKKSNKLFFSAVAEAKSPAADFSHYQQSNYEMMSGFLAESNERPRTVIRTNVAKKYANNSS